MGISKPQVALLSNNAYRLNISGPLTFFKKNFAERVNILLNVPIIAEKNSP